MDAFGHMRADIAHHGGFHRARVGENGAGFEMRRDLRRERAEGADRRAEDDEIGAADRIGGVLVYLIGKAEPARGGARRLGAGAGRDRAREVRPPHRVAERRADQANADQRSLLKHGFCHCSAGPRKAETHISLCDSLQKVNLSPRRSPYAETGRCCAAHRPVQASLLPWGDGPGFTPGDSLCLLRHP